MPFSPHCCTVQPKSRRWVLQLAQGSRRSPQAAARGGGSWKSEAHTSRRKSALVFGSSWGNSSSSRTAPGCLLRARPPPCAFLPSPLVVCLLGTACWGSRAQPLALWALQPKQNCPTVALSTFSMPRTAPSNLETSSPPMSHRLLKPKKSSWAASAPLLLPPHGFCAYSEWTASPGAVFVRYL